VFVTFAVFNQKNLHDAYKKRAKNIEVDMEAYNKLILSSTVMPQVSNTGKLL
jgi:hypothetical protein